MFKKVSNLLVTMVMALVGLRLLLSGDIMSIGVLSISIFITPIIYNRKRNIYVISKIFKTHSSATTHEDNKKEIGF